MLTRLGRSSQPGPYLHKHGLETGVVTGGRAAAVLFVGQVDARGAVQLLQLAVAALLLDHPAGRGAEQDWAGAGTELGSGEEPCPPGADWALGVGHRGDSTLSSLTLA